MTTKTFLAVDLGAESGRVMIGRLERGRLELEEAHRFANEPVRLAGSLVWDLPRLYREALRGLGAAKGRIPGTVDGIGCDSWGVDFGLLDRSGGLLALPVHYRDARTEGEIESVLRRLPREQIYQETGVQFLALNTIFQLAALKRRSSEVLDAAGQLLLMADLMHYLLCGVAVSETCLASTSQLWNPGTRAWSDPLIDALEVPRRLFPRLVDPGSVLGPIRREVAQETGLPAGTPVLAPGSHDTASAVAAVPAEGRSGWAYLSSGTWSLLGVELAAPQRTAAALAAGFTNEAGVAGTIRFLKNLTGLWLVQECRRQWAREGTDLDYPRLTALAAEAGPARAWIVPGDPRFFAPDDMPEAIRGFCADTGQRVPATRGEIVRTALESLALSYRLACEQAQTVTAERITRLHIVGGGSQNALLNQLTANALGIPVLAGPVEATAMGNVLVQALGVGAVSSLAELRAIVRASVAPMEFAPVDRAAWDEKITAYRGQVERTRGQPGSK